ncbi:hypothetical protein EV127DRAFT_495408 [Xylaria flabelliformis]|nr:hypothetical protein EV127DRAFT_495408 [Xylaria flabelliformis]
MPGDTAPLLLLDHLNLDDLLLMSIDPLFLMSIALAHLPLSRVTLRPAASHLRLYFPFINVIIPIEQIVGFPAELPLAGIGKINLTKNGATATTTFPGLLCLHLIPGYCSISHMFIS